MKVKIPPTFYLDHRARENGTSGKVISHTSNYIVVDLDDEALYDLISDAEVYAEFAGEDFQYNRGLVLSARATLKAINKQIEGE